MKIEKDKIIEIELLEEPSEFMDIETGTGNYIAENILVHNSRPHKKSISCGFYIPAIKKDTVDVACAIDTSGSISQKELGEFLSEIVGIAKSHENLKMTIVDCDASIQSEIEVSNGNISKILNMKIQGGGGTSHKPVFKHYEAKAQKPKLLICFTDGYSDFPSTTTIDTLWIITKSGSAESIPFGRIVKCDEL